jgi:HK97 gp10 family phage protein
MTMRVNTSAFLAGMQAAFGGVSNAVSERGLRKVGFAGAEVIRDEVQLNASRHVDTGTLLRNVIVKRVEEKSDGANHQTYLVTVRTGKFNQDGDAFYWRWVEAGHGFVPRKPKRANRDRHRAAAREEEARRVAARLEQEQRMEVAGNEFGDRRSKPRAFFRNAFDAKQDAAVDAMRTELGRLITEGTADS